MRRWLLWMAAIGGAGFAQDTIVHENIVGGAAARLQWEGVVAHSERVIRGGLEQAPMRDYAINGEYGLIEFYPPLDPNEIVEISYAVRPGVSREVAKLGIAPIEASFFQSGPATLGLVAQMRRDGSGYAGVRASLRPLDGWQLNSQYLIQTSSESNMLRLSAEGQVAGGRFRAGYDSAGQRFTEAKGMGARPGSDALTAEWRAGGAFLTYRRDDLASGDTVTAAAGGLSFGLLPGLSFSAGRSLNEVGDRSQKKDRLALAYRPASFAAFDVDWNGEMGSGGETRLRASLTDPIARINATHTMPDHEGKSSTDLNTDLRFTRGFRVQTATHAREGRGSSDAKVWFEPFGGIGMAATYQTATNATYSEGTGVEVRLAPTSIVEVSGAGRRRLTNDKTPVDSLSVQVKVAPVRALSFTGAYADRPEDELGFPQAVAQRKLGATLAVGSFFVGGAFAQNMGLLDSALSQNLLVEGGLRFTRRTSLKFSYGRAGDFTALNELRTYGVGFTHSSGSFTMALEGRMKQPYANGDLLAGQRSIEGRASIGLSF